ncbi:MAG: sigma 54-interacting transcriptional regulator, partial [Deltaproteobacteria bacterium]|nr:sigma 54-interacting transcriptional regulator [Deltaproteobacteria bacterium]
YFNYQQGRHREVVELLEAHVPEITRFPKDTLMLPVLTVLQSGFSYAHTGQIAQAIGVLDALRQHTNCVGDKTMEAHAEGMIGCVMLDIGKTEESRHYFERAMELSSISGNSWQEMSSSIGLATYHYLMGNSHKASELLAKGISICDKHQFKVTPQQPFIMMLCWGIKKGILPAIPGLSLENEIAKVLSTRNVFFRGIAHRYQALLERKKGSRHEKIFEALNLSIEELNKSGSIIETAKTQFEIARQHLLAGEDEAAARIVRSAAMLLSRFDDTLIPNDLKPLYKPKKTEGAEFLTEILKLGQDIVNIRESRDLGLQIIGSVNRLTGAERGALFIKDNDGLRLKASKNITSEQVENKNFAASMKIIEEVARTGISLIKGMERKGEPKALGQAEAVRSIICVPMMLRNDIKGVLYHDNRLLGSVFKKSELNLLAYFAALATIALDNITAYEDIQRENLQLSEENKYLEEQCLGRISTANIIGRSEPIQRILKQIDQVAKTDANVLILGDTGVGKELVASDIHNTSLRKDKPFVCLQCSALPEKLLPSELFGYEKGAFTGAVKRKLGRFELANGGTIFLDEMGELSPDMQVQLLRVLETKQFERIGGTATIKSDFRLVAATNRDLKKEVAAGRFREDLYYRLNVFPIQVPSLKQRREDIPLLIEYFSQSIAKRLNKKYDRIHRDDIRRLCDYGWPGNVRELQNLVERAVIIHTGSILKLSSFPLPGSLDKITFDKTTKEETADASDLSLRDNERLLILQTLEKTNWRVSGPQGAARLLQIKPTTLNFRMQKLGIKRH